MDWYYDQSDGGGEELVPSEQKHVVSDRWTQWGTCGNGNFDIANKFFVDETNYSGEIDSSHDKFSDEVEMDLFSHEKDQYSVLTGLSAETLNVSSLGSVFTEDQLNVQRKESCRNDGNFMTEWNTMKAADLSEHSTMDTHYGKTETWDFSSKMSSEHNNINLITSHHPLVSEERDFASARAHVENASALGANDSITEYGNDNMSVEESLLLDFGLVMNQMSEKTRYCFRDALYRLAKNSESPSSDLNECDDDNSVSNLCEFASSGDESSRNEYNRRKDETKAKTNAIDRTVASLMFSNMNFTLDDHHHQ